MSNEVPDVYATADGTVVIDLQPDQAHALALLLAHYNVLAEACGGVTSAGYVPEVWHHTLVQLLAQRVHATCEVAETTPVALNMDVLEALTESAPRPRHLAVVGGDQ